MWYDDANQTPRWSPCHSWWGARWFGGGGLLVVGNGWFGQAQTHRQEPWPPWPPKLRDEIVTYGDQVCRNLSLSPGSDLPSGSRVESPPKASTTIPSEPYVPWLDFHGHAPCWHFLDPEPWDLEKKTSFYHSLKDEKVTFEKRDCQCEYRVLGLVPMPPTWQMAQQVVGIRLKLWESGWVVKEFLFVLNRRGQAVCLNEECHNGRIQSLERLWGRIPLHPTLRRTFSQYVRLIWAFLPNIFS